MIHVIVAMLSIPSDTEQIFDFIQPCSQFTHPVIGAKISWVCFFYFLDMKIKNFQNRKAAIVENGSWAPMSGKLMKVYLEGMKNITLVEPTVTIKSTISEKNLEELNALADALLA